MFNQPKAAAPAPGPPPRATKPRAFKWKTSGETEEGGSKTLSIADVPPQPSTPTPGASASSTEGTSSEQPAALTDKPVTRPQGSGAPLEPVSSTASGASVVSAEDSVKHKGFSAEDARQSAGSLKERIALLSGLKVDKPDAPGRAPKPWRKKTQEPAEGNEEQPKSAAPDGSTSPSSEQPGQATSATDSSQEQSTAEPVEAGNIISAAGDTEKESAATDTVKPSAEGPVSATDDKHSIALPKMPTRARGPPRKARGGVTSPAVASPATEAAPSIPSPTQDTPAKQESIPSIADISSPAAGPEELGDPVPAAALESGTSTNEPSPEAPKESATEEKSAAGSAPKRTSTNLLARAVPLPPPTAGTSAEEAEEQEDGDGEAARKDEDVNVLESSLARQSLADDEPDASKVPAPVAPPPSRPPAPPPLDTSMSSPTTKIDSPAEITSPTSANTNRRSMTRPPVPSAYSQDSAPPTGSPRSSFDNRSQRSSIAESHRGSLIMSPSQPNVVMAEPEAMAGDGDFANPSLDSKDKMVIPPPVSKPFDTDSGVPSLESPSSLQRQDSIRSDRWASGIITGGEAVGGKAPARSASTLSRSSRAEASGEAEEPETNISAMKAYRASTEEQQPAEAKDEEGEEEEEYEDPEVARRQALAKRMAAMGGMKIGMLPQMPSMIKRKKTLPKESDSSEPPLPTQPGKPSSSVTPNIVFLVG